MKEKFYVSSNGTKTPMKDVEFTHLSNALAKKYREIFESTDEDSYNDKINQINDIKEEIYKRINKFHDESIKGDK